jgi:C4-dicarboxylate-specific signal transduction histidine kinase
MVSIFSTVVPLRRVTMRRFSLEAERFAGHVMHLRGPQERARNHARRDHELQEHELLAQQIALTLDCEDAALTISAGAGQAEQVLLNLLRNAVEALAETSGPRITLRASRQISVRSTLGAGSVFTLRFQ